MSSIRISDALIIDSLTMILVNHGGVSRSDKTEIWEPFSWLKGRMLTWSNVTFSMMNYAVGMSIL